MLVRILTLGVCVVSAFSVAAQVSQGPKNVPEFKPAFSNQTRASELPQRPEFDVTIVQSGFEVPWAIEVMPGGGYLVTERPGRLRAVLPGRGMTNIAGVPEVVTQRQGGLLDVALAEDFETSRRIYLTYSKPVGRRSVTAAGTGVLNADFTQLSDFVDIFVGNPPSNSPMHYGSRIVLDGDLAYITSGEHSSRETRVLAQDLRTTYGKVLRITLDGEPAPGNPFAGQPDADPRIYTYGHRNPQGADLHPTTGELWTLEHGPRGGDELNQIVAGANFGWPIVSYGENYSGAPVGTGRSSAPGLTEPRYYWDPVIAPGGFAFYEGEMFDWQGDIIASSLSPGGIVRLTLEGNSVTGEARYLPDLGRVRDIEIDADGAILAVNDDGNLVRITPR
ncbi:MAG: PQQ-dependent sugar dehydrogenase [Silicimonas sp.]|nr:PQQ-dependent sugar dehydrogenase [Silicimonas sp.]